MEVTAVQAWLCYSFSSHDYSVKCRPTFDFVVSHRHMRQFCVLLLTTCSFGLEKLRNFFSHFFVKHFQISSSLQLVEFCVSMLFYLHSVFTFARCYAYSGLCGGRNMSVCPSVCHTSVWYSVEVARVPSIRRKRRLTYVRSGRHARGYGVSNCRQ